MNLGDTVSLFSTEIFVDAFNPATTFKGRMNPFSEVANSGTDAQRRILEVAPAVSIPQARVIISPSGELFIVAASNHDYWNGEVIRHKFPVAPVEFLGSAGSIGEILAGTPSDPAVYAAPHFARREGNDEEMSDFFSGYEVFFSQVKSFARGSILLLDGEYLRLQTDTFIDGAGFAVAQCVKIEDPLQTFDIHSDKGEYDSTTDSYPAIDTSDVPCFVETLGKDYEFVSPSFDDVEVGDKAISVLKTSVTLGVNDRIGGYRVIAVKDYTDWVTCQCRSLS